MMTETIDIRTFDALDTHALYAILKLRFDIFVLEQQSIYPELDDLDQTALHLTVHRDGALAGVLRILPTDPITIGRVVVADTARSQGVAGRMMEAALTRIAAEWPGRSVKLGAQQHLAGFYGAYGFERCSDVYDDGGIPHIDMMKAAPAG